MATVQDINAEISRISGAKEAIINAIEQKGVETPAETPIQDLPAKILQIETGTPNAVQYVPQELTIEQKQQARENIGASKPELLVAEYNVTPFATVITACWAGKNVIVRKNENYVYVVYSLTDWDGDAQIGGTVKFSRINYSSTTSGTIDTISVDNVDGWKTLESIPYRESFFIAQYGVTHWSEVLAAYKDGKVLLCSATTLAQLMVFDPGFEGDDESEPYEGSAAFIYYDPIEKKLIQLVIDGSTDEWQMIRLRYVSDMTLSDVTSAISQSVPVIAPTLAAGMGAIKIWMGTQSQYDTLTPANDTLYFIIPSL